MSNALCIKIRMKYKRNEHLNLHYFDVKKKKEHNEYLYQKKKRSFFS